MVSHIVFLILVDTSPEVKVPRRTTQIISAGKKSPVKKSMDTSLPPQDHHSERSPAKPHQYFSFDKYVSICTK